MERNTNLEIEKLSNQTKKYQRSITEIEDKSNHFTRVNEKQFLKIWDMNTDTTNELVEKVVNLNFIIFILHL